VEELSERPARALRAKTLAELEALCADLPDARPAGLRTALTLLGHRAPRPPGSRPVRRTWAGEPSLLPGGKANATLVIGRAPHCDLRLPDPTVSRRHAELRLEPEGWVLEDLGSLNGVEVNGLRVRRTRLTPGDEVRLGDSRLRFEP
jgi:hypothetical protein